MRKRPAHEYLSLCLLSHIDYTALLIPLFEKLIGAGMLRTATIPMRSNFNTSTTWSRTLLRTMGLKTYPRTNLNI
jgi:hypothetical protein